MHSHGGLKGIFNSSVKRLFGSGLSKAANLCQAGLKGVESYIMYNFATKDLPEAEKCFAAFGGLAIASSTVGVVGALLEEDHAKAKIKCLSLIPMSLTTTAIFFLEGPAVASVFTGAIIAGEVILVGVGIYRCSKGKSSLSEVADIAINSACNVAVTILLTTGEHWEFTIGKVFETLKAGTIYSHHQISATVAAVSAGVSAVKTLYGTFFGNSAAPQQGANVRSPRAEDSDYSINLEGQELESVLLASEEDVSLEDLRRDSDFLPRSARKS